MTLSRLSLLALAQTCLSAAISYPSVPTIDLIRRSISPGSLGRRQSTSLKFNDQIDYLAAVTFGHQTFNLQIDTGSSDTWVVSDGFICGNGIGNCQYGPRYKTPGTFQSHEGLYLNATYGDGTHVLGPLGHENITIGGLKLKNAAVSIGQLISTTTGDPVTSGILGLGYSTNTAAYNSSTPFHYQSLVPQLYKDGAVKNNLFSIALTGKGGKLAFGGLPDGVVYEKPLVTVPIIPAGEYENGELLYTRYQVNATLEYSGAEKNQTEYTVLMDSGSTISILPTSIANSLASKYKPAVKDGLVPCNATVPPFGLNIGNKTFYMRKEDMISTNPDGTCSPPFVPTDGELIIMGDSFLRSVLVVFDLGKQELGFANLI